MPLFLQPQVLQPQVQMKCAECAQEEEENNRNPPVQKKCAHCEAEQRRQRDQGTAVQTKCAACEAEGLKEKSSTGAALDGVASANRPLPHADRIQASFGRHDIGGARAAVGGNAAQASARMGARAYTSGDRVAFRSEPDLNLAAHEAAHIVQQRNGAKLPGGVGRPGDEYERQADAAANAVERGESAEPILDRGISNAPGSTTPVAQHALAVNASRVFEPASVATHVAMSAPRAADADTKGRGTEAQPRPPAAKDEKNAAETGQGACSRSNEPKADTGPKPAGAVEAKTGGGAFDPHCYTAAPEEPADDDTEEKPDPKTPDPKQEIHPDLPRPDEKDCCPIEKAIATQAPVAAAPAPTSGQSPSAKPAPAGAPASAPASASKPNSPAGAGTTQIPSGASKIPAKVQAAASAPSPLEDAVTQAEAGRSAAVSSLQNSSSATQALAPRVAALSSGVRFLSDSSSAGDSERSQAAESRFSDFFGGAAERLTEALALATDAAPDRFGAASESIKGNIAAGMEQRKAAVSATVGKARAHALSKAATASGQVRAAHETTVAQIDEQTGIAIRALTAAHDGTLDAIAKTETASLDSVNMLYGASYDAHVALGPVYADRAEQRGEQYAKFYCGCKRYNDDGTEWKDSFFAGYLTNRRAEAEAKASRETASGYRKTLVETANDQAAQAMKGRKKDRCGIIASARSTRSAVDDRLATIVRALQQEQQQSLANAAHTRDTMISQIDQGLHSALAVLDLLEHHGKQSIDDTGYLQQLAIEQAAHASATAVQEAVAQAVGAAGQALGSVRSFLAASPAPAPEEADRTVTQAGAGLNGRIDLLLATVQGGVAAATARLEQAASDAIAALESDAQATFDRIAVQDDEFSAQIDSLASGAAAALAALRRQYSAQAKQTTTEGAAGFAQASIGFQKSCDTVLSAIGTTLGESEKRLGQEFEKQIGGLDSNETGIPKQAAEAASKEQPAWKSVVAVILIIAIVIVVALVIGPAVIGAVGAAAAALGASAGVATAVGAIVGGAIVGALSSGAIAVVQNWSTGQRLTRGVWHAMLVGAATGAVGGAIGLGVNAGLDAVLSGSRVALSTGAQFAVRAAVNIASDTLMNVGQQLVLTRHLDWGELAQGVAMSVVLHGSRRVQAFQSRVTAVGARGAARGIAAMGGTAEPGPAATRASGLAEEMGQHAKIATEESTKPLDFTPPKRAAAPSEPTPPAPGNKTPAAPTPETAPTSATESVPPPKPAEMAAPPITGEHPLGSGAEPPSPASSTAGPKAATEASAYPKTAPAEPTPAERAVSEPIEPSEPASPVEPNAPEGVAPPGEAPLSPEEKVVLDGTANKPSEELTPEEVLTEREVANRTKGEPIDDPPFTTRKELPNGHEIEQTPEGEECKRCSDACAVFGKDGKRKGFTAEEISEHFAQETESTPEMDDQEFEEQADEVRENRDAELDEEPSQEPDPEPEEEPAPQEKPKEKQMPRRPKEIPGKPKPKLPTGKKPGINDPDAAEWRYKEYVAKKAAAGEKWKGPDEYYDLHFKASYEGGRPGRSGGPEQRAAKAKLATEGVQQVENVPLGGRYPDGVRPNSAGGTDYFEVGKMNKNGFPESRERIKIADEIPALGPEDTVTFVDKTDISRRITYRPGDTATKKGPVK